MSDYWEKQTTGKKVKIVLVVILTIFIVTFAVVNWDNSEVNFIFFRFKIPVTLLIIACASIGYLISTLIESRHYAEKVKELSILETENQRLTNENRMLKEVSTAKANENANDNPPATIQPDEIL